VVWGGQALPGAAHSEVVASWVLIPFQVVAPPRGPLRLRDHRWGQALTTPCRNGPANIRAAPVRSLYANGGMTREPNWLPDGFRLNANSAETGSTQRLGQEYAVGGNMTIEDALSEAHISTASTELRSLLAASKVDNEKPT
jgi:hypothetical protein